MNKIDIKYNKNTKSSNINFGKNYLNFFYIIYNIYYFFNLSYSACKHEIYFLEKVSILFCFNQYYYFHFDS